MAKARTIKVDAETADLLEARAAARKMTVSELVSDLAANDAALPEHLATLRAEGQGPWSPEALEEDARGPAVQCDPRTHPSDRSQGAAEAKASEPVKEAAELFG